MLNLTDVLCPLAYSHETLLAVKLARQLARASLHPTLKPRLLLICSTIDIFHFQLVTRQPFWCYTGVTSHLFSLTPAGFQNLERRPGKHAKIRFIVDTHP